jgi:hypothetical protein
MLRVMEAAPADVAETAGAEEQADAAEEIEFTPPAIEP